MMKDEYDFGDLPFGFDLTIGVTSRLLFILFMFLVTIVMMNLLNGLAIYDIQDIKKQVSSLVLIIEPTKYYFQNSQNFFFIFRLLLLLKN